MNGDMAFLLLAAVIFAPYLLLMLAVSRIQQKEDRTHDERSVMLRLKAYRDTFYFMFILCAAAAVVYGVRGILSLKPLATVAATMFLLTGTCLSFLISDFILRGVYLGRRDDEKIYRNQGFAMLLIVAFELAALLTWEDYSGFAIPFEMGSEAMMLVTLIWCVSICISSFYRYHLYKKDAEE